MAHDILLLAAKGGIAEDIVEHGKRVFEGGWDGGLRGQNDSRRPVEPLAALMSKPGVELSISSRHIGGMALDVLMLFLGIPHAQFRRNLG
jgi:hypothetical protein